MSVANAIADALVTAMNALAIANCTVVKRKKPSLPPGVTLTLNQSQIVVSVGDEQTITKTSATKALVPRLIIVAYIANGGQLTGDDPTLRDRSELIRRKLFDYATYDAIPEFNDLTFNRTVPFDPAALTAGYDYASHAATIETHEVRS